MPWVMCPSWVAMNMSLTVIAISTTIASGFFGVFEVHQIGAVQFRNRITQDPSQHTSMKWMRLVFRLIQASIKAHTQWTLLAQVSMNL